MSKTPYFGTCGVCKEYFAKAVHTIDVCKTCFEDVTSDLWGMHGVPTE